MEKKRMKTAEIFDIVTNIIVEKFNYVGRNEVELESDLTNDLGLDSLDLAEFTMKVESDFNIDLDKANPNELNNLRTVEDVVDLIYKMINQK